MRLSFAVAIAITACQIHSMGAQPAGKKASILRGTVEQVNQGAKRLSVTNEPIPGGMGAMTMTYAVDKDEVLTRVKAGDHITAKMYEGDLTLFDVQVVNKPGPPQASTDGATGLRLEEFERMALANNPTMAQVQANVRMSAGRARQASFYPNPTVGYYGDEIRGGYSNGGKQGGFISQTIVTGGKLRAARRVADLLTKEAETTGEVQRFRILNNVRMLFYQVLAEQKRVEVRQSLAKLAADATQTSHQLFNVGQADRPDVLQAEVEQQQVNVNLRVDQQNLQSSWRTLTAVAGKPDLPQTRLEGDLEAIPDLHYDEWLATTLRDSPQVKLAQQAADRAEASLVQVKKAPIPDLQFYGNLSQNNQPLLETSRRITGIQGGVQLGVQLPIFNRNQGNVAAAKAEIESAQQDLMRTRLQIARDMATLFRDYESARTTAQQYKTEMLPRAEEAYRLYQANYQNMAAAYPQALISQRTWFQLQVDYVQALESAWQASLGISGFGLVDGLSLPGGNIGGSGMPMMGNAASGTIAGASGAAQ
jgi:cobalt-zinc-cadmium efflux system outer membrane protein